MARRRIEKSAIPRRLVRKHIRRGSRISAIRKSPPDRGSSHRRRPNERARVRRGVADDLSNGTPFPPGLAEVKLVRPASGDSEVVLRGHHMLVDVLFSDRSPDGFFVLEFSRMSRPVNRGVCLRRLAEGRAGSVDERPDGTDKPRAQPGHRRNTHFGNSDRAGRRGFSAGVTQRDRTPRALTGVLFSARMPAPGHPQCGDPNVSLCARTPRETRCGSDSRR